MYIEKRKKMFFIHRQHEYLCRNPIESQKKHIWIGESSNVAKYKIHKINCISLCYHIGNLN